MAYDKRYDKRGQPPKYTDPDVMAKKIDEYFDYCDNRVKTFYKDGQEIIANVPAPYTMSGLARALGMSRLSLINYSKKEDYFNTINNARERVQEDIETRLLETSNQAGAIFNLKNNFGWRDKTEQEVTGGMVLQAPILGGISVPTNNSDTKNIEA
jgi:excinuclease UvrABC nuclease subunit